MEHGCGVESTENVSKSYFKGGPSASDGVKRMVRRSVGVSGHSGGKQRQGGNEPYCLY